MPRYMPQKGSEIALKKSLKESLKESCEALTITTIVTQSDFLSLKKRESSEISQFPGL